MDTNMKVNADKIRELRNNKGWSQEQLATFSGLGLRTIQRIEAEGNISRESKVCLAATFDVELSELDAISTSSETGQPSEQSIVAYQPNRTMIGIGIVAFIVSLLTYLLMPETTVISVLANMACITAAIHTTFSWYFHERQKPKSAMRRAVRVSLIYIVCYSAFALLGGHSASFLLNGVLSGVIFGVIYFGVDSKLTAAKARGPQAKQA